nr:hypothetical protein GCM10020063_069630 [Dactylosporangium thailandense]
MLHDDVVVWSDGGGLARSARNPIRGRDRAIRFFVAAAGRRLTDRPAILNGHPALLIDGRRRYPLSIAVIDGRIAGPYLVPNPSKLAGIDEYA